MSDENQTITAAYLQQREALHRQIEHTDTQRAESGTHEVGLSPEAQQMAENLLGRKLSRREIIDEAVSIPDTRDFETRVRQDTFQPVLMGSEQPDVPFAAEIAAARKRADEAAWNRKISQASPEDASLMMMERVSFDEVQRQATAKAWDEELTSRADMIAEVKRLQKRAKVDPTYSHADRRELENTLSQLTTPGTDRAVAEAMFKAVAGVENRITESFRAAIAERLEQAKADYENALRLLGGETDPVASAMAALGYLADPEYQRLDAVDTSRMTISEWARHSRQLQAIRAKYAEGK